MPWPGGPWVCCCWCGKINGSRTGAYVLCYYGFACLVWLFYRLVRAAWAVGLWLRKLSFYAASGLLIIMIELSIFHIRFDEISTATPAIILSAFLINIIFARVDDRLKF